MSWRDRIDPELTGSFRGVSFHVERADTQGGRRWLVHEYPRRDRPYTEDMGRRAKEWRLTFFVAGDDYDRERDALIEALDAPGAATLVHPYLGSFSAVATDVRWSESTRDGGVCSFQVTFAESGEEAFPATTVDTRREVQRAAEAAQQVALEDFLAGWSIEGLLGVSLDTMLRDVRALLDGLEGVVGGIADELAGAIRFPATLAGIVMGGFNRLRNAVMRPVNALDLYSDRSRLVGAPSPRATVLAAGETTSAGRSTMAAGSETASRVMLTPGTPPRAARVLVGIVGVSAAVEAPAAETPWRQQRAANIRLARQLIGRTAAVTAARVVADTDWISRSDAEATGDDSLALIDLALAAGVRTGDPALSLGGSSDAGGGGGGFSGIGGNVGTATGQRPDEAAVVDDDVYRAFESLRLAVVTDLRRRAVARPGLSSHTPQVTTPALVVAHRLYGDATRADEICVRNGVPHPGALRGGMSLEVLSE